jgi:hypothetical protein
MYFQRQWLCLLSLACKRTQGRELQQIGLFAALIYTSYASHTESYSFMQAMSEGVNSIWVWVYFVLGSLLS